MQCPQAPYFTQPRRSLSRCHRILFPRPAPPVDLLTTILTPCAPHTNTRNHGVIENLPANSGTRTQFLKRMARFTDWSGLEVRLVYYPPYHSKYNPVERCWSALERKWNGVLLNCVSIVLACARRMTWRGKHPEIHQLQGDYPMGVKLSRKEMKPWEARLERSPTLPKYDITIKPQKLHSAVI